MQYGFYIRKLDTTNKAVPADKRLGLFKTKVVGVPSKASSSSDDSPELDCNSASLPPKISMLAIRLFRLELLDLLKVSTSGSTLQLKADPNAKGVNMDSISMSFDPSTVVEQTGQKRISFEHFLQIPSWPQGCKKTIQKR